MPPSMAAAQTPHNLTRGSSLTTSGGTTELISPSGDFTVGFRPLESDSGLFLLAIWFTKAPNQTVVWTANRKQPVQAGSKLEIGADGRLVLTEPGGTEVWSSITGGTDVVHAAMLDSGNFVLAVSVVSANYTWGSFDVPTDTILPSQVLALGRQLTSRLMESDYSEGRFLLRVQEDGNLVLYNTPGSSSFNGQLDNDQSYWASNTVDEGQQLVFSIDGDIFFHLKNGSQLNISSAKPLYSPNQFYQRATLDPDGTLRHYVCPRNISDSEWTVVKSLPSDICRTLGVKIGSGVCGFNSYCTPDRTMNRLNCNCPPSYSFVDPARKYKGCKPDFISQTCDGNSTGESYQIQKMVGVDWPFGDYERLRPVSEDECSRACLNDCFCALAIHRDDNCWKKRLPLSNGRYDTGDKGVALIKVANMIITASPSSISPPTRKKGDKTWLLILLGCGNCLLLGTVIFTVCFYRKMMLRTWLVLSKLDELGVNLRAFTFLELQEATEGFKTELGRGGSGTVYKGIIGSSGTTIAVKRLEFCLDDTVDKTFENEARIVGQIHHKNLVPLLGYCNEGPHRLLVYEYMSNGSLLDLLLGSNKPDWATRVQLASGVARGLLYLHEDCSTQIIHCDIKPQNILIDDNLTARITDFGLSKLLRAGQSRTITDVRGTRGYVAPEWFKKLPITSKVDVHSFGVLLLEIICCRRSVEAEAGEAKIVLVYWAYDCFKERRLDMLVEEEAEALADMRRLERLVMVALWCIQEDPSLRPTMKKVTQMLEGAVEIPVPPDPSSYLSSVN